MAKGKINPLQNDCRDEAQPPRDGCRGQFFRAYAGHHSRINYANAPGQPTHGADGGLADDKSDLTTHFILLIHLNHNGKYDEVGGGHTGCKISNAADNGGYNHNDHYIHSFAQ